MAKTKEELKQRGFELFHEREVLNIRLQKVACELQQVVNEIEELDKKEKDKK